MCLLNGLFNSFWGFPVGKAPPAQLALAVLPKGDEGWLQKDLGVS